jgi:RIO-like serine/threonine protein kinase
MEEKVLIAKNKSASVYKSKNQCIKVFDPSIPKTNVLLEALNTARVEETGLNIPSIQEISLIDNKWAITMDYIEGTTLAQLMKEHPDKIQEYLEQMVELQIQIHAKRSPLLNKLKDKLKGQISSLNSINEIKKYDLLTRLDGTPKHIKVCHGDFNPHNIIITKDNKMYTLDWIHATQGNASADVAKTYLLFAFEDINIANQYMNIFCTKTNTEKRYVQQWLPIVAAAQLTKQKPEEVDLLMKWLDVVEYE